MVISEHISPGYLYKVGLGEFMRITDHHGAMRFYALMQKELVPEKIIANMIFISNSKVFIPEMKWVSIKQIELESIQNNLYRIKNTLTIMEIDF